ncbi:deoxyhypusine synthase-like [Brachionus plicatilis]|uniref:deoxyhypusine synthase n=1 Tax=Brachionus plicatilis TaxID=10195 RepID=A0A3M7QKW4_BRAPC|nr:deoxyhypusine synthase-like [Brachionus plicatilis]
MESDKKLVEAAISNVMQPTDQECSKKFNSEVKGYDFNQGVNYDRILSTYVHTGFQASNLGKAINEVNRMIKCKLSDMPEEKKDSMITKTNCTIFLGYTSNMISCGMREYIRFLVQHKMVDCLVCTAGGIEEDFIKCLAPTLNGDFHLPGSQLRAEGINRIGNLLIPNDNYCKFEDWIMPIFDKMVEEQQSNEINWTPSKIINRLGKEIDNPDSVYYWAYKNYIPVFSPALTDGSLGDMMYFHSYRKPGLVVDILEDLRLLNNLAVHACNTGMIILGGGLIKHHVLNANLMRNGADFSVFINTASEFDGSDAGASPDEAISWGKIRRDAKPVKVD